MSTYNYNPIPPRVWSRVQNPCTYTVPGSDYTEAFIPLTGQTVSQAQADYETKQIYKGNILQYKGNSARFTKSQRYSQLARMAGPNRTKVFATQSQTYTNPNTTGLLRVGFQTYPYPNQIVGAPNNISGPFQYNVQNPYDCSGNSVQDGGTLVCGTFANPCTGEIIKQGVNPATICNPASASDVPGTSILCWNNKVQTWFPRQRYFMNNSTDKWPVNYKGFVSATQPTPPIISASLSVCQVIDLSWTQPTSCLQISSYNIYINNILNANVPSNINNYTLSLKNGNYVIYLKSLSDTIESSPSNVIDITIHYGLVVLNKNNLKATTYEQSNTRVVVIESTLIPRFNQSDTSSGLFLIDYDCEQTVPFPINMILVGGGGGGGSGYANVCGGGGGGSAGINYIQNLQLPTNTTFTITVGVGGGGRRPGNQGGGNSAGKGGQSTSIIFGSTQITSYGGGPGLGIGTASGYGGGTGGNAVKISEPIGPIYQGYGGSSGGGSWNNSSTTSNSYISGPVGNGYTSNGIQGSNGVISTSTKTGGNGANSIFQFIHIPIIGTIYFGGSGGGGGYYGANAGNNSLGGTGGQTSSGNNYGENSSTYGAGGGGGGGISNTSNIGGNGANGVIIIWWTVP